MKFADEIKIITDNMDEIDRITGLVVDMLKDKNYPVTYEGVKYNICRWRVAKDGLIQMFSKHPNWNPQSYMIAFDTDWERTLDLDTISVFFSWMRDFIYYNSCEVAGELDCSNSAVENGIYEFLCNIEDLKNPILSSSDCESIKYNFARHARYYNGGFGELVLPEPKEGMKTSRWVGKLCNAIPFLTDQLDYERKFAAFADAINPIVITRHTLISLNPIDYLLCSNGGEGGWRSCHSIDVWGNNPGQYSSGNLSYMNDSVSFLLYTVDKKYDGDRIELERKISRNYFAYDNYRLLQQRVYPQTTDRANNIYEQCRKIVQKVIADVLEEPDLWTVRDGSVNGRHCQRGAGSTNYHDWAEQDYCLSSMSVLNSKTTFSKAELLPKMNIGAVGYFLNCAGRPIPYNGYIIDQSISTSETVNISLVF